MSEAEEFITITEAAQRLGVTIPRLRRFLARPEWSDLLKERETRTRTGTRTARTVSVLVLHEIGQALKERDKQEREREHSTPEPFSFPLGEQKQASEPETKKQSATPPDAALVAQLQAENAFLRGELTAQREAREVEASELRRLMLMDRQELLELRQRVALVEAPKAEATDNTRETLEGAQKSTSGGWWARLFGKGKG